MSRGIDREALEVKARAMFTWKEPPEKVERALVLDGLPEAEAQQLVAELVVRGLSDLAVGARGAVDDDD